MQAGTPRTTLKMKRTLPTLQRFVLRHELLGPQDGKIVVFLHGLLGSGNNLRTLAKRIQQKHNHIAPLLLDLRGHGQSPSGEGSSDPTTLNCCAKDVINTVQELGLRGGGKSPVCVIGHRYSSANTLFVFHGFAFESLLLQVCLK